MYVSPSMTDNGALPTKCLGKRARYSSVAPVERQCAWETAPLPSCSHEPLEPLRADLGYQPSGTLGYLPGCIPELPEQLQHHCCAVRNTAVDTDPGAKITDCKDSSIKINKNKWTAFKRWIKGERKKYTETGTDQVFQVPYSKEQQTLRCQAENADNVRIFIPFESAKLCIAQVAEDMQLMKNKHLNIIQELEENFQIAAKENQEKTAEFIRKHYQNKMNTVKRILEIYQKNTERKNICYEETIKELQNLNHQLIEEKTVVEEKNRTDSTKWEKEKSKILELFSKKLDLLHIHQASTLQELQIARMELGKVQEMLKSSPVKESPSTSSIISGHNEMEAQELEKIKLKTEKCCTPPQGKPAYGQQSYHPTTHNGQPTRAKQEDRGDDAQSNNYRERSLEGAQACLEVLKNNLYKREREITEFLWSEKGRQKEQEDSVTRLPSCAILLRAVIEKAHNLYREVPEAKCAIDHMSAQNTLACDRARDHFNQAQSSAMNCEKDQGNIADLSRNNLGVDPSSNLQTAQETLQKTETIHIALECIRKGSILMCCGTGSTGELNPNIGALDTELNEEHSLGIEEIVGVNDCFTTNRMKNITQKLLVLQTELKQVKEENKNLIENFNSERVLRKKYYNMVEDMKGKIRVFCRIRPLSKSEIGRGSRIVVDCPDDYTVTVESSRGLKEFQFDKVFNSSCTQEDIFDDTSRLIQSAVDGYNVCIFAYGQTGSGKTFTLIGDKELKNPGVIPRAFQRMFHIIEENKMKFDFKVSVYMLELYNERLLDLFANPNEAFNRKTEIKKDRKGLVFVQGAETKEAASAEELFALFEQGCTNRHIADTKMNSESSRSHLIIGVTVESTNRTNGSVTYGKLSLVDLAGSERAAKTGAKDEQLKEANSINKSLSALSDVIFALSTEQCFIPYRNNKLTQVMQDSLGGNAKTLMFVNISPSDYNVEETLTSLIYATRVKAITNNVQKNSESKEIAHLKEMILKLKSGQSVEEV